MQTKIPCVIMRGGTSRGPFFNLADLPADTATRDAVLLAVMGSPHEIQVDGIGGANSVTSKVAMISKSQRPGVDVDYLFAQVEIIESRVDTKPNCGNMLVAVGPFAIDQGLVAAQNGETAVRIFNVNTQSHIEAIVQTPGGVVTYEGTASIDGVQGTAAPVGINFAGTIGSVTKKLLPTGKPLDIIDGIEVSCVDVAMPVIMMRAEAFGKTGYETASDIDADKALFKRMEAIRLKAGVLMGLGDVSKSVVPKMILLAKPRHGGLISSRFSCPTRATRHIRSPVRCASPARVRFPAHSRTTSRGRKKYRRALWKSSIRRAKSRLIWMPISRQANRHSGAQHWFAPRGGYSREWCMCPATYGPEKRNSVSNCLVIRAKRN